jgi:hypothetical protein
MKSRSFTLWLLPLTVSHHGGKYDSQKANEVFHKKPILQGWCLQLNTGKYLVVVQFQKKSTTEARRHGDKRDCRKSKRMHGNCTKQRESAEKLRSVDSQ